MKHTLRSVSFEVPDDLPDASGYSYLSPDERELITFQLAADNAGGDADAMLAYARTSYERIYKTTMIYSAPTAFVRGGGVKAPGVEGERLEGDADRYRFAIAAITSSLGRAMTMYLGPSRPDGLRVFQQAVGGMYVVGEPGSDTRRVPSGHTRRQAGRVLFALPRDWTGPGKLLFEHQVQLRVDLTQPAVPEGTIDLSADGGSSSATPVASGPLRSSEFSGWSGEWRVGVAQGPPRMVRKMCVTLADKTVLTALGRAPVSESAALAAAWDTLARSIRAARGNDG